MGGSSTYIPLLDRGEVDFGLTNVDDALSSYKGAGNFKRPSSELRLTAVAFPLTLGVIVPNDSPIRSIGDLKGKVLPWGRPPVGCTGGGAGHRCPHDERHQDRADPEPVLGS